MKATVLALVACLCAAVAPAEAQIYTWHDASGAQVFSDRPQGVSRGSPATGQMVRLKADLTLKRAAAGRFDDIIERHAASSGISADLIRAVIQVESGFNPSAVSPKGAQGLMQLMPATARDLGVVDAFHPEENIRGGVAYLKQLLGQYSQDLRLALAAYNAGPANVARYGDVPPFRETQAYVKRIASVTGIEGEPAAARGASTSRRGFQMYKWVELVNGRPVPRYSNVPPSGLPFEVVRQR